MGDEIVESVQAEEFKTPVISTRGQAFLLLFKAISFFWDNDRKKVIAFLVLSFAVALILYNNINVVTEIYNLPKHFSGQP